MSHSCHLRSIRIARVALMSSNKNEVIRAVLKSLFFEKKKILHAPKAPKASKASKAQKGQKRNQAKVQNANKRTKIKNALKKGEKSHLFAYLRFCVFCARKEKKIENRK